MHINILSIFNNKTYCFNLIIIYVYIYDSFTLELKKNEK